MYRILGGDGNVYGPVNADTLRRWIGENRLNGDSRVQRDDGEWRTLRELPELAEMLPGGAVGAASTPAAAADAPLAADYQLDIGDALAKGWRLYQSDFGLLFGMTLLFTLITGAMSALGQVPIVGALTGLVQFVIGGPLTGGLMYAFVRRNRGEQVQIGDLFDGFRRAFLQLFLCQFVTGLFTVACMVPALVVAAFLIGPKIVRLAESGSLGSDPMEVMMSLFSQAALPLAITLLVCMVPVTVLSVRFAFSLLLVIDRKLEFWPAMKLSWQRTGMHFWSCLGLAMLSGIVVSAGVLGCGVGLLFTIPIGFACYAIAYQTLFQSAQATLG